MLPECRRQECVEDVSCGWSTLAMAEAGSKGLCLLVVIGRRMLIDVVGGARVTAWVYHVLFEDWIFEKHDGCQYNVGGQESS